MHEEGIWEKKNHRRFRWVGIPITVESCKGETMKKGSAQKKGGRKGVEKTGVMYRKKIGEQSNGGRGKNNSRVEVSQEP